MYVTYIYVTHIYILTYTCIYMLLGSLNLRILWSLVQHKCILRPVNYSSWIVHGDLPLLWCICIFYRWLNCPIKSDIKNLIPFLLCDLLTVIFFYRSHSLPLWMLKRSSGKLCEHNWLTQCKILLSTQRLKWLRLQWKPLVSKPLVPARHLWLPCVGAYHLPALGTEQ